MALNSTKYFLKLMRRLIVAVDNTAAPGINVVTNSGTDPSRVYSLALTGDTSDRTIFIYHHDGTTYNPIWTGTLPTNTGIAENIPAIDLIRENRLTGLEVDDKGNFFFDLPSGHSIRIRSTAAPTVSIFAMVLVRDFAA
jgi:hypothetical protein